MPNEMSDAPAENLSPRQAAELAVLVELEARWVRWTPLSRPNKCFP
jgi:hypothetical protein